MSIKFETPAFYDSLVMYQNVNDDEQLQKTMISYFYKKLYNRIDVSKRDIYDDLVYLHNKYNINWYEMRLVHKKKIIVFILHRHK